MLLDFLEWGILLLENLLENLRITRRKYGVLIQNFDIGNTV